MPSGTVNSQWIQCGFLAHLSSLMAVIRHSPARGMIGEGERRRATCLPLAALRRTPKGHQRRHFESLLPWNITLAAAGT
jgi:hypothetical protein